MTAELKRCVEAHANGHVREALDLLFDLVDGYVRREDFVGLDALLASTCPEALGTQLTLGLLLVTRPWHVHLPHRARLLTYRREDT